MVVPAYNPRMVYIMRTCPQNKTKNKRRSLYWPVDSVPTGVLALHSCGYKHGGGCIGVLKCFRSTNIAHTAETGPSF